MLAKMQGRRRRRQQVPKCWFFEPIFWNISDSGEQISLFWCWLPFSTYMDLAGGKKRAILRQYWGNIEAILRQYWGNIEAILGNIEGSSGVAGRPGLEREYAAGNLPSSWGRCRGCASGRSRAANVYLRSPYMPSHIHSIRGARAMTTIDYQGQWRSLIIMINGMVNDIDHW